MAWTDADFYAGDGSVSFPFVIHDKPGGHTAIEQFMDGIGDSNYVGKGYYFQLGQDLDFDGITVKCVGRSSTPFVGTIDGNGYTIKNIHATITTDGVAVFVFGGANSFLKNCVFDGTVINRGTSSTWSFFMQMYSISHCVFNPTVSTGKGRFAFVAKLYTKGAITDCIITENIPNTSDYVMSSLFTSYSKDANTKSRILMYGTYYGRVIDCYLTLTQTNYNQLTDCVQLGSAIHSTIIDPPSTHYAGRIGEYESSSGISKLKISNCYAREDCTVGGSVPTQYCSKDHINGESVSADVYQQKGFWDGSGVDGTVYLDWDFDNVWDWDEVNLRPILRMSHAPIPSLVTGVWVKTEEGWKQSTDLTYMR